jgi:hypothetical protein
LDINRVQTVKTSRRAVSKNECAASKKAMRFLTPGLGFHPHSRSMTSSAWALIWAPTNLTALLDDLMFHVHAYRRYRARRRLGVRSLIGKGLSKGLRFIARAI